MELRRYEKDGLELVIDVNTGECFASQSALARMCNKGENTIRNFLRSQQIHTLEAQIPTGKDSRPRQAQLVNESDIYKCLEKYNTDLLIKCSRVGLRVYLYSIAGYKLEVRDYDSEMKLMQTCLNQVMDSMLELHKKIDNQQKDLLLLAPIAERTEKMEAALQFLPELEQMLQDISDELNSNPNQKYKTMRAWLDDLSLPNLGRGTNVAMGRMIADFFKIGKLDKVSNYTQTSQNKYPESFVPVIKKAYQFMLFAR